MLGKKAYCLPRSFEEVANNRADKTGGIWIEFWANLIKVASHCFAWSFKSFSDGPDDGAYSKNDRCNSQAMFFEDLADPFS